MAFRRGPEQRPRLARGFEQRVGVVDRHDRIAPAVQDQDRDGRDLSDPARRAVLLPGKEPGERILERPGQEEAAELLPGDPAVAREGAVDDQRPHLPAVGRRRRGMHRHRAADALAQDRDLFPVDPRQSEQRLQGCLRVTVEAGDGRVSLRQAVTAVVDDQDVEPLQHHPEDAVHVGAEVLGVPVQDQQAAPRLAGAEVPAVQPDTVRGREPHILGREHPGGDVLPEPPLGKEVERTAARGQNKAERKHGIQKASHE